MFADKQKLMYILVYHKYAGNIGFRPMTVNYSCSHWNYSMEFCYWGGQYEDLVCDCKIRQDSKRLLPMWL